MAGQTTYRPSLPSGNRATRAVGISLAVAMVLLQAMACAARDTRPARPNILFCIADDATWHHMSAYGCTWVETPAFDRVANDGILFSQAYTPNAKCAPSRAILLTGRNSWQLEQAANHLPFFPPKFKTYPEALAEAGYHVGYTGKGWAPGTALTGQGAPRELLVAAYNAARHSETPTNQILKTDYVANFERFLAEKDPEAPFCFWYGGFEPHRPYAFKSGVEQNGRHISDIPGTDIYPYWPVVDTVRHDLLDYAMELEYFDSHLGRMLQVLEKSGQLDNTLVVVTADNGMPFPRAKGQQYEQAHHMPLAIMWPAGIKKPGRVSHALVSFTDLTATILDAAGLSSAAAGMEPLEGRSLALLFAADSSYQQRAHLLLGKERHDLGRPQDVGYPIRGILKEDYLFLVNYKPNRWPAGNPETGYTNTDGSPTKSYILNLRRRGLDSTFWQLNFGKRPPEELFHISTDPACMNNLANEPALAGLKASLRQQMEQELLRQGDPRMQGLGDVFDQYPPDRHRGLYNRIMRGEQVNTGWINRSDRESNTVKP